MNLDVNLVINEYDKIVMDLLKKNISLKVENDMLKKEIEELRKVDK